MLATLGDCYIGQKIVQTLHRFALLVYLPIPPFLPGDSRNHHALPALISSCKISCIYDNFPAFWLLYAIVIVFFLFMIILAVKLAQKKESIHKNPVFGYFVQSFYS